MISSSPLTIVNDSEKKINKFFALTGDPLWVNIILFLLHNYEFGREIKCRTYPR